MNPTYEQWCREREPFEEEARAPRWWERATILDVTDEHVTYECNGEVWSEPNLPRALPEEGAETPARRRARRALEAWEDYVLFGEPYD